MSDTTYPEDYEHEEENLTEEDVDNLMGGYFGHVLAEEGPWRWEDVI